MKKVLVTGATGSLGSAIVKEFARQGYFVYIHYNSKETKAKEILKAIDNHGEILTFESTSSQDIKEKLEEIEVDVLINNSGITRDNLFFWMSDEEWEEVMDTNVNGMFRVTKAMVPKMIKKKDCAIVNISSISGMVGNMGQTNYSASKGAIISFTKSLALELARYRITVNCVAPGLVASEMTKDINKEIIKTIPLKRYAKPEEVAHAVFFASTNSYMTAEVINISGGLAR